MPRAPCAAHFRQAIKIARLGARANRRPVEHSARFVFCASGAPPPLSFLFLPPWQVNFDCGWSGVRLASASARPSAAHPAHEQRAAATPEDSENPETQIFLALGVGWLGGGV
jgi:hypothetical protein